MKKTNKTPSLARKESTSQVAETFSTTPVTIRSWIARGCPANRDGQDFKLNVAEVAEWRRATGTTGAAGRPRTPGTAELIAARVKKELYLCEKYRLEIKNLTTTTYALPEIKSWFLSHAAIVKAALDSLPDLPSLWGLTPPQLNRARTELNRFVDDVYKHLQTYTQTMGGENVKTSESSPSES